MAREKDYNPIPVYNRKLARSVIKNSIEKRDGFHNTNKKLHDYFEKYNQMIMGRESNSNRSKDTTGKTYGSWKVI